MKKILLFASLLAFFSLPKLNAQVLNSSFETWTTNTAYFDGFGGFFPKDTFTFSDPVDWTTTNALSGADTFGHLFLVTQSATMHSGSSAMQLTTRKLDTVHTPLGDRQLTIPGLALNGTFALNIPQQTLLLGGTISPSLIPNAGQPIAKRLGAFNGYYNFTPVFNDSTGTMDSCMIWATLRRGNETVANAVFKSNVTTPGYVAFSVPFEYVSCAMPDTLVILVASSVPNFGNVLLGTTRLTPGSVLLVDDFGYDTLAANFNYPPIANKDNDTTYVNVPKTLVVLANDADCDNQPLTTSIIANALNGTSVLSGNDILYTPNTSFTGFDSIRYQIADANGTAQAWARIVILGGSGISETNGVNLSVYPVPASNILNVQFENTGKTLAKVYDMIGNLVMTSVLTQNNNQLNIATLANGFYGIQLTNEKNVVIARSKFTVAK